MPCPLSFRGIAILAVLLSSACGTNGRVARSSPNPALRDPPRLPLAMLHRGELPIDARGGLVGMQATPEAVRFVWAENAAGGARGLWAEVDLEGSVRWVRELPFIPSRYGRLGERDVFVVEDRRGTLLCTEEGGCGSISPMRGAHITFGRDEVIFDFGVGLVRSWLADGIRIAPTRHARIVVRHTPASRRVGPCGDRWLVAIDGGVAWLDRLGDPVRAVPPESLLLADADTTYAVSRAGDAALNLCTGERVTVAAGGWTLSERSVVALFRGRHGMALVRRVSMEPGHSWSGYDHPLASQELYAGGALDPAAPRVVDALLDVRGRLWIALFVEGGYRFEIWDSDSRSDCGPTPTPASPDPRAAVII